MLRATAAIFLAAALAGCSAELKGPSLEIDSPVLTTKHASHGHFCPPGQAKKGNC